MKKLTFLLVTLLIGGVMLTGCKKEEEKPTPEPTPTETTIVYSISNTYEGVSSVDTLSPGLYFTFTYTDADGKEVKVENAELPWKKTITVTSPFEAKLEGEITYKEEELPEKVVLVRNIKINLPNAEIIDVSKIKDFKKFVEEHPEMLKFSLSGKVE